MFNNTMPDCYYWLLFGNDDFRQAVGTAKRVMNEEVLDRQLIGQSPVPFMFLIDSQ